MSFLSRSLTSLFIFSLPAFAGSSIQPIQNFYQVGDHVYRGAQPTDGGFKYLAKKGVKTVLDLREYDERSSAEEHVVTALGMRYVNVPMTGLTPPADAQISKILVLLEDNAMQPVPHSCTASAEPTAPAPLSPPTV